MNALLEQILDQPDARQLAETTLKVLNDEQTRRLEFYAKVTEQEKAEFINGQIVSQSPVMLRHSNASQLLLNLMQNYAIRNNLGCVGHEKLMIALTRNSYEPDIVFFNKDKSETFKPNQMFFPAPDLAVEILSESTEHRDRGIKFKDYAQYGVWEYWLVDPKTESVEIYRIKNGEYELVVKTDEGEIESAILTGFKIPVRAIFDEKINTQTLLNLLK